MRFHLTRNAGRLEGFLVDNSTYDSNPCSANCMLNPVYDILPRGSWLVRSGVCQMTLCVNSASHVAYSSP